MLDLARLCPITTHDENYMPGIQAFRLKFFIVLALAHLCPIATHDKNYMPGIQAFRLKFLLCWH